MSCKALFFVLLQKHSKMKLFLKILFYLFLGLSFSISAQEYKNFKKFRKEMSLDSLPEGVWLKKDRRKNTKVWQTANYYNLLQKDGATKYHSIRQIRDFYLWFDKERIAKGHETNAVGIAAVVANQLSVLENWFIKNIIITNKEVHCFGEEGSRIVLAYAFPHLQELYFSPTLLKGEEAFNWDLLYAKEEQCVALETLYHSLSPKTIKILEKMAKGKGIYCLGVPKALRFEGEVMDCNSRYEHAITKVSAYYLNEKK